MHGDASSLLLLLLKRPTSQMIVTPEARGSADTRRHALVRAVRFDERDWEAEPWLVKCDSARKKGRQQLRWSYSHSATSRLHQHR
jgi:hypothetical protein